MTTYNISEIKKSARENGLVLRETNAIINGKQGYAVFIRGTSIKKSDDAPLWWWSDLMEFGSMSDFAGRVDIHTHYYNAHLDGMIKFS